MNFLFAVFFGAGVAGFAYSEMGQRIGYGNSQNVWTFVAIAFVLSSIFFYTLITYVLGFN